MASSNNANLKKAGLQATVPRIKILEVMAASTSKHISAEEVYHKLIDSGTKVGLATVYRVLNQFESAGLVRRHHFEVESGLSSAVYELEYGDHHDHMVCGRCRHIIEFYDKTIQNRVAKLTAQHGFSKQDHTITLYVNCTKSNCPNLNRLV